MAKGHRVGERQDDVVYRPLEKEFGMIDGKVVQTRILSGELEVGSSRPEGGVKLQSGSVAGRRQLETGPRQKQGKAGRRVPGYLRTYFADCGRMWQECQDVVPRPDDGIDGLGD
jgi:hypothetical protein